LFQAVNDVEEGKKSLHSDQKFADHMQTTDAVSDFACKKSLKEQRQYLPIFAVRNEVIYHVVFKIFTCSVLFLTNLHPIVILV
jgi:hypothetical protein